MSFPVISATILTSTVVSASESRKRHVSYEVLCATRTPVSRVLVWWKVHKRYSDFLSLHNLLGQDASDPQLPVLPPKLFNLFGRGLTDAVQLKRRQDLEAYLTAVLALQTDLADPQIVVNFCEYDAQNFADGTPPTTDCGERLFSDSLLAFDDDDDLEDFEAYDEAEEAKADMVCGEEEGGCAVDTNPSPFIALLLDHMADGEWNTAYGPKNESMLTNLSFECSKEGVDPATALAAFATAYSAVVSRSAGTSPSAGSKEAGGACKREDSRPRAPPVPSQYLPRKASSDAGIGAVPTDVDAQAVSGPSFDSLAFSDSDTESSDGGDEAACFSDSGDDSSVDCNPSAVSPSVLQKIREMQRQEKAKAGGSTTTSAPYTLTGTTGLFLSDTEDDPLPPKLASRRRRVSTKRASFFSDSGSDGSTACGDSDGAAEYGATVPPVPPGPPSEVPPPRCVSCRVS